MPRNIVIVGGSYGIGAQLSRRCLESECDVFVLSRTGGEVADLEGVRHIAHDVISDDIPEGHLPDVVDGYAYCPGSIHLAPLRRMSPQQMRDDFELNVVGAMRSFQAIFPRMKQSNSASAVFFSTVAVAKGLPMHTSISASKGAIEALVRTWAAELAPAIRVNGIAPALTDTRLASRLLATEEKRAAMAALVPLGRIGQAKDAADVAAFLLSEHSSWMTGQILAVDGGMSTVRN
jgi:NAD(P)-dependent dehydrogenase (short-subunit alcohol dehydrogenase family)